MKTYSIGEFANTFGVSADLLRYYEKKGLITPHRNKENNYRYYTDADIFSLQQACVMRSIDVPLRELKPQKNPCEPNKLQSYLQERIHAIEQEIDDLNRKLIRLEVMKNVTKNACDKLNTCEEILIRPMYLLFYDDQLTANGVMLASEWMRFLPFVAFTFSLPSEALFQAGETQLFPRAGLQLVARYAESQDICLDPPAVFLTEHTGIRCVLQLTDPLCPRVSDFEPLVRFVRQNDRHPVGDLIYGVRGSDNINGQTIYYVRVLLRTQ